MGRQRAARQESQQSKAIENVLYSWEHLQQPVPDLSRTLSRYLAGLRAVIPAAQCDVTRQIVEQFRQEPGPALQEELGRLANSADNWRSPGCRHIRRWPSFHHEQKLDSSMNNTRCHSMTPSQASSPVLSGQRFPVAGACAHNCTSCNLLHIVWVETDPPAPRGNRPMTVCHVP
ncbi:hypothetical protein TNCV_3629961 [Trichonephila clavipes]|nr:hypothetical protein TNCV_3629961 [Trichonephila clavipes]